MSQSVIPIVAEPPATPPVPSPPPVLVRKKPSRSWVRSLLSTAFACVALAAAVWFGLRAYRTLTASHAVVIPTAIVQRGDVSLTVTSRGELLGGHPEVVTAPMTGGTEMHLTFLLKSGAEVNTGDTVAQFDTTEQEYKLKEAEADLAEADQHLIQAHAQREADEEEDRYALIKAKADLSLAELDVRQNPILPAITAKQNDLALDAARDHLRQLEQNLVNRKATNEAAIAMQEAGRGKADAQATTARQNIEAMTLRAHSAGYISVRQNTNQNFIFEGMLLPPFQVGDSVRPGMAVAEIPDLKNWEVSAHLGELDRGHLAVGDKVVINVIAVPHHPYAGHIKEVGAITGRFWNRRFECKIAIDNPTPQLRPGMSAEIVITTDQLHDVLSLPAQALFESDGRTFVYVRNGSSFMAKDVKLVRRNETRVVLSGLTAGQVVALANPTEVAAKKSGGGNALQALPK